MIDIRTLYQVNCLSLKKTVKHIQVDNSNKPSKLVNIQTLTPSQNQHYYKYFFVKKRPKN